MPDRIGLTRDVLDRARRSRDARFDGKFFVAVTSTRIYCRPICPAKLSQDANVRYYATAAEAAAAGFRPCLRCRPEAAPGSPAWLGTSAVVRRALRIIQDGALDESSVEAVALRLGVGPRHLSRLFTRHLGASPTAIAQTRRLHFAKQLLDETPLPITEIALASGFRSVRRFNDAFKATYKRPPREVRKRMRTGRTEAVDAEIRLRLAYRPPYDWPQVLRFLEKRAIRGVERIEADAYVRTVRTATGSAVLQISPVKATAALELCIRGGESSDLLSLSSMARRMFDLSADPSRIATLLKRDPLMSPLIVERPGLRIPGTWGAFEAGVRAIIGQQISVAAGRTLLTRLVERTGERVAPDEHHLSHLFPTPASVAAADLEALGLPRARAHALLGFARAVRDRVVTFDESGTELIRALSALPGVGPWTAGYIALRGLGEPDAFPSADLILRRQAARGDIALTAQELEARAELWRPFRGYAVLHLWEASAQRASDRLFEVRRQPVPALRRG
jgi:AraC family transcriptional regulator of adaptative response / DNA-3-methyladenine glycosylase II